MKAGDLFESHDNGKHNKKSQDDDKCKAKEKYVGDESVNFHCYSYKNTIIVYHYTCTLPVESNVHGIEELILIETATESMMSMPDGNAMTSL